jgi:hypothetical protein
MTLLNRQPASANEQKGELLKVTQNALGTEYVKWLLVLGDEKEAVMIVATFPKALETELSEKMKASLLTARWHREKIVSPTEGLRFTVDEKGDMKLAKRITNTLLYTRSGIFPSKAVDNPLFIVGEALSRIEVDDKEAFAKARISDTATINNIEIETSSKIVLDNLNGYEIVAKGKDVESGQPMVIYLTILFESQGYFLMQGIVSEKQRSIYLAVFKEMARTYKRKK